MRRFGDMLSNLGQRGSELQEYEYCGIPVLYEGVWDDNSWSVWEPILERWMPRFDEAGWLDELTRIEIGDSCFESGAVGRYWNESQHIAIRRDPEFRVADILVDETREYALLHEMVHHVHMRETFDDPTTIDNLDIISKQHALGFDKSVVLFEREVSEYAGSNYLEAVAETGAGIMLGNHYPARVRRAYLNLDGPKPLRNWREPTSVYSVNPHNGKEMNHEIASIVTYKANADQ